MEENTTLYTQVNKYLETKGFCRLDREEFSAVMMQVNDNNKVAAIKALRESSKNIMGYPLDFSYCNEDNAFKAFLLQKELTHCRQEKRIGLKEAKEIVDVLWGNFDAARHDYEIY